MTLMYDAYQVTIHHAAALDLLAGLIDESVDLVLTDPPYLAYTHEGARSNKTGPDTPSVDFAPMTIPELDRHFAELARVARRWIVATVDWRYAAHLAECPPPGARFVRCGVWVKDDPAPQMSGDRPAAGWEAIAMLHTTGGRMRWNGGGLPATWGGPTHKGGINPTQKPIHLWRKLIQLFSDPGDLVVDPFAGSGTTYRAAADTGRRALGCDMRADQVEGAVRRMAQQAMVL